MASEARTGTEGKEQHLRLVQTPTPGWLRTARAVAGIGLLALSWATIMVAIWLAVNTLGIPPHRHPIVRIALYVLGAVGSCWLGVMAIAAVLAGAFCLMLALTSREW